jgi:hypothetical protein
MLWSVCSGVQHLLSGASEQSGGAEPVICRTVAQHRAYSYTGDIPHVRWDQTVCLSPPEEANQQFPRSCAAFSSVSAGCGLHSSHLEGGFSSGDGDRKPTLERRSAGDRSFTALLLQVLACGANKLSKPRPVVRWQPLAAHQLKHGVGFVSASLALFRIMRSTAEESNAWHFATLMISLP